MRIAERSEAKGMCISLLRNEAVLRDIRKTEHRVNTAVHYIDFPAEFRRFRA